jgi:lambda family phage portal protein
MRIPFFTRKKDFPTGAQLFKPSIVEPWHAKAIKEDVEFNQRQKRMYEAAITSNLNLDFIPTVQSANAEILNSIYIGRGRARTLAKDDATSKGIYRTYRNNVCGEDPFRLEMGVKKKGTAKGIIEFDDELNDRIEEAWERAGKKKNCTVRRDMSRMEMFHCAYTAIKRDGSVLARHHRMFPYNKSRYAIELIENDRLQESYEGKSLDGNPIRFSIERDPIYNFPIYYWILTRHPGEVFSYVGPRPKVNRERIPADDIIHFNNLRDRAEQDIGFPEFDSIIQHLHLNRQFDRAHVSAAIWSAAKPFYIIQKYPTGMPYVSDPSALFNPTTTNDITGAPIAGAQFQYSNVGDGRGGGADKRKMVEPATGELLDMGKEPYLVDPKFPIEAATAFKKSNGELTSVGAGLSYAATTGDFEKMSFSVARSAQVPERQNFRVEQNLMILNFVEEYFGAWLECEMLYGTLIDLPYSRYEEFCEAAQFFAQRWEYIQPVQDAQADLIAIEGNIKSRGEVLRESPNGRNFSEVIAELSSEEEIAKKHGIDLHQEVTLATIKKGEPGETQPQPDEKDNPPKNGNGRMRRREIFKAAKRAQLNGHTDEHSEKEGA